MKLLFSEHKPDYSHYTYPYVVWAFPEPGEKTSQIFNQGFLPATRNLDRFYLVRQIRVDLARFKPSSENRRILRKGEGLTMKLVPRAEFDYTPAKREFFKAYADVRYGKDIMGYERLDSMFSQKYISHLMVFTDTQSGADVGTVTMFLEDKELAFYSYSFYDLNYFNRNLGMYMMTATIDYFAKEQFRFMYLGTCYSRRALYKTQFPGVQFFNGCKWSENLEELKYMVDRGAGEIVHHLLETDEYKTQFCDTPLNDIAAASSFKISV